MSFQTQRHKKPQNLTEGPVPSNSLLYRVLTILAVAVSVRIRDTVAKDPKQPEVTDHGSDVLH